MFSEINRSSVAVVALTFLAGGWSARSESVQRVSQNQHPKSGTARKPTAFRRHSTGVEGDHERISSADQFRDVVDRAAEQDGTSCCVMTRGGFARYSLLRVGHGMTVAIRFAFRYYASARQFHIRQVRSGSW
jgi:hypothetical protein